jgi:predicted nucleotidyltransferase component of viral defense system
MVKIPLFLKLKKQAHKNIASAQDLIVIGLYKIFDKAILHGGTSIWRCYAGNRFSEDIDVYIPRDEKRINIFFDNLKKEGFVVHKKKVGKNSLYSNLEFNRTFVRFEALFKKSLPIGSLSEYEKIDGNLITVYTLLPEELIMEKVSAYLKRHKVRDIYDIFFLLRYVEDKKKISKELKKLIKQFKKPVDAEELKVLVIEGLVPGVEEILDYIKRRK